MKKFSVYEKETATMPETPLQARLRHFLDRKGLSVARMEKQAGLKINVIRNILRGQSKRPTTPTLKALAHLMNCSLMDLLSSAPYKPESDPIVQTIPLEHPDLLQEALKMILETIKTKELSLSLTQILSVLHQTYEYALNKASPKVDKDFIAWSLKNA